MNCPTCGLWSIACEPSATERGFGIACAAETTGRYVDSHGSNEEMLSGALIFGIRDLEPGVRVYAFDKGEEASNGADFALAVEYDKGKWREYLVQAKRMYPESGLYNYLNSGWKKTDKNGQRQIDRLIAEAKRHRIISAFALYNGKGLGQYGAFVRTTCNARVRAFYGLPWETGCSSLGVTLVGAPTLLGQLENGVTDPQSYLEDSYPFECVLCPQTSQRSKDEKLTSEYAGDPSAAELADQPSEWVVALLAGEQIPERPYSAFAYAAIPLSDSDPDE